MAGVGLPWELMGNSPERGRRRGAGGRGLGATRGAARAAPWEGLQALLTASCFLFSITCCAWLVLAVRA
jgi:hypothetical protein